MFNNDNLQQHYDDHYHKVVAIAVSEAITRGDQILQNPEEFTVEPCDESTLIDRLGPLTTQFFRRYPRIVPIESTISLGQDQLEILEIEGFPDLIKIGMDETATIACVVESDTIYVVEEFYDSEKEILDYPYPSIYHVIIEEFESRHSD